MILSQKKRLLVLLVNFLVMSAVYWGFGNTPYTLWVTYFYYAACLILSVLYILVAGGLKSPPLPAEKRTTKKKEKEKIYHPVKKREKFRAFRVNEEEKEEKKERELGPNLLGISEEKRPGICIALLLFVIPLYFIFLLDWFYLKFFV